jgi:hypothetical protein
MIDRDDDCLREIARTDNIVAQCLHSGVSLTECIVLLARFNQGLQIRLQNAEGIMPRRYRLDDGRVISWKCPWDLVPIEDLPPGRK